MRRFKSPDKIRVGVVGYGGAFGMGKNHLDEMKKVGMTPTAVCEIDPARLKVASQDFPGIETYSSLGSMLKKSKVNLVTLITPHNTHAKLALQCLAAGRHVVCEKPMAITTGEVDSMIAAARRKGLVVTVYHNRHWDGCIRNAVKRIRAGAIGEVFRIEAHMAGYSKPRDWWRSSKKISGGVMYDWGVHLLEYSLQIMNSDMAEVTGFAKTGFWAPKTAWKKDTNEDEGFAVVRFSNGKWLTLCISSVDSNPKRGMLEITGTRGTYIFDYKTWEIIQPGEGETVVTRGNSPESQSVKFYGNVADHLVKGTPLVITPEWARRPIHILDLACQSARKGRTLKVKYV